MSLRFHGSVSEVAVGFSSGEATTYAVQGGAGAGFRRDLNWWVLVIGPPILVFSIIGWLLFRDRRGAAEEQTRVERERRRSLELTATFRPGDSAADGAFFSIPLDEEKLQVDGPIRYGQKDRPRFVPQLSDARRPRRVRASAPPPPCFSTRAPRSAGHRLERTLERRHAAP